MTTNPKPENVKCPECSGPMISRTGKFGVFWGCKAYPECKGTRDSLGRSKADRAKEKGEEYERDDNDSIVNPSDSKFSFKRTR